MRDVSTGPADKYYWHYVVMTWCTKCTVVLTFATSRQNPAIPVLIMGLSLFFLSLWAFFDRKRIQKVLNGDTVEYINGEEI